MPNISLQNTSISLPLVSASQLKALWRRSFCFSLHRATVHPGSEECPAEAKEPRYLQMWRKASKKLFFLPKIKGWRVWTSQGQFHMPLRGPIVPAWNRTPLYVAALKNNVGPPHNRICGIPTGPAGLCHLEFFALAMVRTCRWPLPAPPPTMATLILVPWEFWLSCKNCCRRSGVREGDADLLAFPGGFVGLQGEGESPTGSGGLWPTGPPT